MSISFAVIGERPDDPLMLLLRGDDGDDYVYDLANDRVIRIEPEAKEQFDLLPPPVDAVDWGPFEDAPSA